METRVRYWCLLLVLLSTAAACRADTLTVGYFELPPHVSTGPDGEAQGAAVDYFRRLASRMQLTRVRFDPYPLARLQAVLASGELDAALVLARNAEREQQFVYPSRPFFVTQPVLAVVAASSLQQVATVEDLVGLRIGVWQLGHFSPLLRDPRLQLLPMAGDQVIHRNLLMLQNRRIDAFFSPDQLAVQQVLVSEQLTDSIRLLPLPEQGIGLYTVFSKQAAPLYLKAYEAALEQLLTTAPYVPGK